MKGPSKVDNHITSKVDRFKVCAIFKNYNNIRVENKDPKIYV